MQKALDKSKNIPSFLFLLFGLLSNFQSYLVTHAVYYGTREILLDIWKIYHSYMY